MEIILSNVIRNIHNEPFCRVLMAAGVPSSVFMGSFGLDTLEKLK